MNPEDVLDHGEDIPIASRPAGQVGRGQSPSDERSEVWSLLAEAIRAREQVVATYAGRRRAFCPHALGYKGDASHVLVYQFADERELQRARPGRRSSEGWRCLDLSRLADVTRREGPWHSAPNIYNPQSCLDDIRVVVQVFPTVESQEADSDHGTGDASVV